ncbi:MAG: DUF6537 domain-containing protein, partial [Pseudomonadota bacterium]
KILKELTPERMAPAMALAELPLQIRGFGPVKAQAAETAALRRSELWQAFETPPEMTARAAE